MEDIYELRCDNIYIYSISSCKEKILKIIKTKKNKQQIYIEKKKRKEKKKNQQRQIKIVK